jgi:hypothetical protein
LDHDENSPASQVRVCVPQLPQACSVGPEHSLSCPHTDLPLTVTHDKPSGQRLPHVGEASSGAHSETPEMQLPPRVEQQAQCASVSMVKESQA